MTYLTDTGLEVDCVVAEHMVKPGQGKKKKVEVKGASQYVPTMKLKVARVKIH